MSTTFQVGDRVRVDGAESTVLRVGESWVTHTRIGDDGDTETFTDDTANVVLVARAVYLDDEDHFLFEQIRDYLIANGDGPMRDRLDAFLARLDQLAIAGTEAVRRSADHGEPR